MDPFIDCDLSPDRVLKSCRTEMFRLTVLILLAALLPRLAFASPLSGSVCFAPDHVSTACHVAVGESERCSPSDSDGSRAPDDNDCVDVSTDVTLARHQELAVPQPLLGIPDFATPVRFVVPVIGRIRRHIEDSGSVTPPFSARDFACAIAPRC